MPVVRKRLLIGVGLLILFSILSALTWRRSPPHPNANLAIKQPTTTTSGKRALRVPNPELSLAVESSIRFAQIPSSQTGIVFEYFGSPSDEHYMTEQNGGGVGLFDADNDGRLDVFLANGSHFKNRAEEAKASQRLYRQTADWQFDDITEPSGLQAFGFGQGCAAADFDNDGFCDLFVTNFGASQLWHNNGDGTFAEVAAQVGVNSESWGTSAAFSDLDGDGNLELYVVNYVDWTPNQISRRQIPSPMDHKGLADSLYKNSGDGQFVSIGNDAGIAIPVEGKGLALAITDLTGDALPDIYIANDTTRNFLFRNLGHLKFEEVGVTSGCAVSQDGSIGSSMGVAVGDYNRDGWFDLFVTNFSGEVLDAFSGAGPSGFIANNAELGLDPLSRPLLNFGVVLTDFDSDMWPDLFFANGHLWDNTSAGGQYQMRASLVRNFEGKRFRDVADSAGPYFQERWLGRAVACGDLDNDGDPDLVVSHLQAPPALLCNESERSGHVLQVKVIGTKSARQPLGVRVEARVGSQRFFSHLPSGGSFQASHDSRLLMPIGNARVADEVRVHWHGGLIETWNHVSADTLHCLIEGTGRSFANRE